MVRCIVGLPANLFYGTGIPACIVFLDGARAGGREGVFFVDAGGGFVKEGAKNRLRERDIRRIADVVAAGGDVAGFARRVGLDEVVANGFNLNIPRYVDGRAGEDVHDLRCHLHGGLPAADVEGLGAFWAAFPGCRAALVREEAGGGYAARVGVEEVAGVVFGDADVRAFGGRVREVFAAWVAEDLRGCAVDLVGRPKALAAALGESIFRRFAGVGLFDPYCAYEALMRYWDEVMQDDAYLVASGGWVAVPEAAPVVGGGRSRGWVCELLPKALVAGRFFGAEVGALAALRERLAEVEAELGEVGEDEVFGELGGRVAVAGVRRLLGEFGSGGGGGGEDGRGREVLGRWLVLAGRRGELRRELAGREAALDEAVRGRYAGLGEVLEMVVVDKWGAGLGRLLGEAADAVVRGFVGRVEGLFGRYAVGLEEVGAEVAVYGGRRRHLEVIEAALGGGQNG